MFYEELMMDSQALIKFKLFQRMLTLKELNHSIAQLAKDMTLSYQQTFIELKEIDQDLNELAIDHKSIIGRGGKIQTQNIKTTIDDYRYFLLKKSIPFLYVLYLLNEEQATITDFCQKYYVSRSTVSRKFEKLKTHLKRYNLRFTYTESNLVGDERLVRLALFNLIWLGVRGLDWPFVEKEENAETLVESFSTYFPQSRSYLDQWELKYFAALLLTRVKKGNFVKYDKRYNFLMKHSSYFHFDNLKECSAKFPTMSEKQSKAETSFIYFISRMIPFYTNDEEQTLNQTIMMYTETENPIYPMITAFLETMKTGAFARHPELLDKKTVIGNLLNISFGAYVFHKPFPTIYRLENPAIDKGFAEEKILKEIDTFFTAYRNEHVIDFINDSNQKQVTQLFKNELLPLFDIIRYSNPLTVGIALENNFSLTEGLYLFLKDLRFIDVEPYNNQKNQPYDLVISSQQLLKKLSPDCATYIWDYSNTDYQYINLYYSLKKHFDNKNKMLEEKNQKALKYS